MPQVTALSCFSHTPTHVCSLNCWTTLRFKTYKACTRLINTWGIRIWPRIDPKVIYGHVISISLARLILNEQELVCIIFLACGWRPQRHFELLGRNLFFMFSGKLQVWCMFSYLFPSFLGEDAQPTTYSTISRTRIRNYFQKLILSTFNICHVSATCRV